MIGRLATVLALAVAACGARPREPRPTPIDAGTDAALDAPAPDPATAELLAAVAEQRDRACDCPDAACAEEAAALAVQWGLDHPDVVRAATPTAAEEREIAARIEAAEVCLDRWLGGH